MKSKSGSCISNTDKKFLMKSLETVYLNCLDGMAVINTHGRVLFANRAMSECFGLNADSNGSISKWASVAESGPQANSCIMSLWTRMSTGLKVGSSEVEIKSSNGELFQCHIEMLLLDDGCVALRCHDATELKRTQERLQDSLMHMAFQRDALERKNVALKEILAQIEAEKIRMRRLVTMNIDKRIIPTIRSLRSHAVKLDESRLKLLEQNLGDLISEFGMQEARGMQSLTPREMDICNMIRSGMPSKEIGGLFHVSLRTIETHRNNIRKKLGLDKNKQNLTTYLRSL